MVPVGVPGVVAAATPARGVAVVEPRDLAAPTLAGAPLVRAVAVAGPPDLVAVKCTSAVPQGQLAIAFVVSRCICLVRLHVLVCRSLGGDPLGVELRGRFVWGAAF